MAPLSPQLDVQAALQSLLLVNVQTSPSTVLSAQVMQVQSGKKLIVCGLLWKKGCFLVSSPLSSPCDFHLLTGSLK